jgi:Uma2 family endonuclease
VKAGSLLKVSAQPARKAATYADLLALPPELVGQLIDGDLYAMPRPTTGHAGVTSVLGMDLGGPFQRGRGGPGGWWLLDEPELHLGPDVLVPDLAGWRVERMPHLPKASEPFISLAPDWVCEVLSPSTASLDRVKKKRVYAREQVSFYWLIDPLARTLEALKLDGDLWVEVATFQGDDRPRGPPFEAVELELGALWSPPDLP